MGNCLDCKWDRMFEGGVRAYSCFQGRGRISDGTLLENCKDWEEKEECRWCINWYIFNSFPSDNWFPVVKYLITLGRPMTECPECGKKLEG